VEEANQERIVDMRKKILFTAGVVSLLIGISAWRKSHSKTPPSTSEAEPAASSAPA